MAKHTITDLDNVQHKLTDWFKQKLSQRDDLVLEAFSFPENTGESNVTLVVDVNWNESGERVEDKFVVRLLPEGAKVFNDYNLELQYQMLTALVATDVPVPPLLGYEGDSSVVGGPFYVMHFVAGQIPSDNPPMHMTGWLTEVEPEQRARLWWSGVEGMAGIHRLSLDSIELPDLSHPERGASFIEQQIRMYEDLVNDEVKADCDPAILQALSWCRANMPDDSNVRLCWGDARPANMIFRDYDCIAVLDWEMATLCNPLLDLAWWVWMDYCLSTSLGIPRLEGFPERDETLHRWQQLTNYSLDGLPFYELFAVVRYAIIMERVFARMVAKGEQRMDNFVVPIVKELHDKARASR